MIDKYITENRVFFFKKKKTKKKNYASVMSHTFCSVASANFSRGL